MKHRVLFFTPLFIFLTSLAGGQSPTAQKNLSLKNTIDAVLVNNPSLRAAREKIRQLDLLTSAGKAKLYPKIDAALTAYQRKDSVATERALFDGNSYQGYTTEITLDQPLFKIGTFAAINSVEKEAEIGKLDSAIAERDLIGKTITSYYEIVFNSKNVETLLYQQRLVKESQKVAEQHVKIGRGQKLDVLQIKTQSALLDAKISAAQNQLQIAAANLAFLMGENNDQSFRIKATLDVPPIMEIDRVVNLKDYKIPELQKDEISLLRVEDLKRVALGQNLPYLSLVGTYSFASYKKEELYNPASNSWYLGLKLTVPLFSGFSTIYEQSQFSSQLIQLEAKKRDGINLINFKQVTSRKNLETAHNSIRSGEEALKFAIASHDEAKKNYKYAMIDFLQLSTVQQSYVQAEQSLNEEKYNYVKAVINYFVSSGQDLNQLAAILEKR